MTENEYFELITKTDEHKKLFDSVSKKVARGLMIGTVAGCNLCSDDRDKFIHVFDEISKMIPALDCAYINQNYNKEELKI